MENNTNKTSVENQEDNTQALLNEQAAVELSQKRPRRTGKVEAKNEDSEAVEVTTTVTGKKIVRFMRFRKIMGIISLVIVLAGIGGFIAKGLNLGLDFTGGVSAEVMYDKPVVPNDVAQSLEKNGFDNPTVQNFGTQRDIQLRVPPHEGEGLVEKLTAAVQLPENNATVLKIDAVGAQVGEELYVRSLGALALALGFMMMFIAVRFQFKLAVGAVMALIHDVLFVIGVFAIMGWTFDFSVLAAVLALIGYSLNDTIVVFDRIRENFKRVRGATAEKIIDISLTETLRRTIMTSVSTMTVVLAMLLFGGDGLRWFSIALMLGLIAGTYSSIYIASSYALSMGLSRNDFIVKVKPEFEEEVVDFE